MSETHQSLTDNLANECRAINRKFRWLGGISSIIYIAIVGTYWVATGESPLMASGLGAIVIQFLTVVWVGIFIAPYFVRMERKTDISIRLGSKTAEYVENLQIELRPILNDVRIAVGEGKALFEKFKDEEYDKFMKKWNELSDSGKIDRIVDGFLAVPDKLDQIVRAAQGGGSDPVSPEEADAALRAARVQPEGGEEL